MSIANSPTRQKYPLSPKKITKKTLTSVIGLVICYLIFVPIAVVSLVTNTAYSFLGVIVFVLSTVILLLIIIPIYLYQKWYFDVYFYDLTPDFIIIRKGPITPREITIPYERVQDVYVDQDIFDRLFGIFDVHLSSATVSSGMEAHIDGVEKAAADGLRTQLLTTVSSKMNRNSPPSMPTMPPSPPVSPSSSQLSMSPQVSTTVPVSSAPSMPVIADPAKPVV